MAADRVAALTVLFTLGCAGIRGDLAAVRDVTKLDVADVSTIDVEPQTPAEARAILAKPVDADAAVRIALLDNRELRATLREIGIPRGRLVQAWALPNPRLDAEFTPERESNLELRAEWDLTRVVLTPLRARAVSLDVDAARYRAAAAAIETGFAARAAFYRAQAAQEKVAVAHQALDTLAANRDAAEALYQSGNIVELDFAQEDVTYQNARAETAEMELEAQVAREALVRVLGLHGADTQFAIAGAAPGIPDKLEAGEDIESRALRASLELKERRTRLEAIGRRAGYARLEGWIPDVAADVHALQPRDPATGMVPNEPWLIGSGLRIGVPLFDRNQGTAAALDAEAGAELERYYGAAVDVRSTARSAFARLVTAHGKARLFDATIVPARKRVVAQSTLQYNAMRISIFQLLAARHAELESTLEAIDARAAYWTARAAFDALLVGRGVTDHAMGSTTNPRGD